MTGTQEFRFVQPSNEIWNEYVLSHPHGNIFQNDYLGSVYRKTKNHESFCIAVTDSNDTILAGMQIIIIKELGILGALSARAIIQGGPLFEDSEDGIAVAKVLMRYYDDIAKKKVLYTEIRNMWDTSRHLSLFCNNGYTYEPHLNYINNLGKDQFKKVSKKRRYGITKAQRNGVIVEEIESEELIPTMYRFLKETYSNARLPIVDISFFITLFDLLRPKGLAKAFLAKHENNYIGTIVVLLYKNDIYDLCAGASREHLHLYPNDMLPWHIMEWGLKNGYAVFDFGGAGNPEEEYGVRDFKKQFGGELVNFGRYKKVHSPKKLWLITKMFTAYRYLVLPLIYRIKGIK
jgi:serine/alanine adding enzyme